VTASRGRRLGTERNYRDLRLRRGLSRSCRRTEATRASYFLHDKIFQWNWGVASKGFSRPSARPECLRELSHAEWDANAPGSALADPVGDATRLRRGATLLQCRANPSAGRLPATQATFSPEVRQPLAAQTRARGGAKPTSGEGLLHAGPRSLYTGATSGAPGRCASPDRFRRIAGIGRRRPSPEPTRRRLASDCGELPRAISERSERADPPCLVLLLCFGTSELTPHWHEALAVQIRTRAGSPRTLSCRSMSMGGWESRLAGSLHAEPHHSAQPGPQGLAKIRVTT
jgi:hypothetical protein